jgi:putative sigma-54 modulation protein
VSIEFTVTGRHVQVTDEMRDLITQRLAPLERLLGDAIISTHVMLNAEHQRCVSELELHARGDHRLHGLAEGPNWQAAVGGAVDKVTHQAQTLKGKWQGRRRREGAAVAKADLIAEEDARDGTEA